MKWEGDWWGITITAESESDNELLDNLSESLPKIPASTYDGGELESRQINGFKSIILNR